MVVSEPLDEVAAVVVGVSEEEEEDVPGAPVVVLPVVAVSEEDEEDVAVC